MKTITRRTPSAPLSVVAGPALPSIQGGAGTLLDLLRTVGAGPDAGALVRVGRDGESQVLGYAALRDRAQRTLAGLRAWGMKPGEELVLLLDDVRDVVPALWACLAGGFAAVPVGVPDGPGGAGTRRIRDAWEALDRPRVLAAGASPEGARALLGDDARVASPDAVAAHEPDGAWHPSDGNAVGLILLSSGTTGRPKLVQRTHHNLFRACQVAASSAALAQRRATMLSWYPLDHSAGIMSTLAFLVAGARQVHLATRDVLEDPERWLDALHLHGCTHTGVTGYLLGLLNASLAAAGERGWDFSRVERVTLSAEPVAARAASTFLERMAPHGLRAGVLCSAYGMSEAGSITLLDTVRPEDAAHTDGFLPVGTPYPGISLRVVDAGGRVLPEGREGRIQVSGETVTPGYARAPELTAESFAPDGWLDTGDAGFLRAGALTLTGRRDDVLIVNGLNLQGREVEAAVEEVDGVARGHTAVCAVRVPGREQEAVAVFLHTPRAGSAQRAALRRAVRVAVVSRFAVPVAEVILLDPAEMPRTSVGKIRRRELRRMLAAGELARHAAEDATDAGGAAGGAPRTELERALCALWAEVLGVEAVGVHDGFLGLGGHSLLAVRIAARVRAVSGVEVPLRRVFEASTVAELAGWIETSGRHQGVSALPPVVRAAEPGPVPASSGQRGLWLSERVRPGTAVHNVPRALRLHGPLRVDALGRALSEVVARHEALRTVFAETGGELWQHVLPAAPVELPEVELATADPAAREAAAAEWMRGVVERPFDLACGPLLRAALLRVGPEEHLLVLCMHHIVTDGGSIGVLYRELETLYGAFARGEASPLAQPAVQYGDYARWQRSPAVEAVVEEKLGWWRERLAGAPARLELPTDRARGAVQDARGGAHRFDLPPALWQRVQATARAAGATPFMLLLGAFQALLGRYARTGDVVVGTAVAGRDRPEVEGLVGCFVNALAMRADLSGNPTVAELLERVREGTLEAFARQEVPLERVVGAVVPERTRGHRPLFQVMFTWQGAPAGAPRFAGLETTPVPVRSGEAEFDLSVTLAQEAGGVRGVVQYAAGLYEAATVERLARHYAVLLEGMVQGGDRRLDALTLLDAGERAEVLGRWNAAGGTDPGEEGLHAPFERRAAAAPDAVALEFEGGTLTYGQLDACAERLARRLRALGVGTDVVVAICGERSPQVIVALLAVLKAGGAYLPLDPAHPADRLAYMLGDARPRVLLARPAARAALPPFDGPVLELGEDVLAADADEAGDRLAVETGGSRLAYVIYTSGSTGRPKGVMIGHRSIRNRVMWAHDQFPLQPSDVVLLKTPLTFDASIWELFLPLWSGARVVVAPPAGHQDAAYLARALRERGVTVLQLVPSMLQVLLSHPEAERCTGLRLLFCGGEAFPVEVARRAAETFGARVVNLYGPTEASIDVSAWELRGDEPGALLPIGRPVNGTRLYLLDERMEPVPVGVPGEVYAGGPGLARGYLNRAGLTAEKFVPDPFTGRAGGRLYRTGDVGRRRGDGAVEFLGRTDQQVKLRGLRIEPGEIEALLAQHEAVETAVVAVRADGPGGDALVAYVVPAAAAVPTAAELRAHLGERLPEYMVPAAFVLLPELPRTASGKVDRTALPAPRAAAAGFAAREGYVPPRSPVESLLCEIWSEVLKTGPVGVHERFFDLGGHSLSVLQLLARVRAVLKAEIPLKTLFDAPTVAGLAVAVERVRGQGDGPAAPPLVASNHDGPHPLSFAQQRLWLLNQLEPESPVYNLYSAFPFPGGADAAALKVALGELVRRHAALRTTFPVGDGEGAQQVHPPEPVPLPVADFGAVADRDARWEAARAALRTEVLRPFDLAAGPLMRATLVRMGEEGDHLVLVLHHVVTDGWSMDVVRDDLAVLYDAAVRGEPAQLSALPVQYADYARWEREWLSGEVLEANLAYWRGMLAGAPPVIQLPSDRPRPAVQTYRGDSRVLRLPAALATALRKTASQAQATLFMTLLASFKILLHRWGAGTDLLVGTHVAGRDRLEVERLVGFFVNALVLRTDLSGDPTFREVLDRVRDGALGAFSHAHLPFERLVEELSPVRDLSLSPLYQVSFDYQRAEGTAEGRPPALLESAPSTKFDLEVTAVELEDELRVHVGFSTDLFDGETIERMLAHLEALLRAAAAGPKTRISQLSMLSDAERARLAGEMQGARRTYPVDQTLDRLIAAQAARTPDAVAAVHNGETVTYAEMGARSNRIAHLLRGQGVGRGDRVAVMVERGIGFVTSIAGVLKAGAAYVPVDPTYPGHRLRHMLSDSGAKAVITRDGLAGSVAPALADAASLTAVLSLDETDADFGSAVRVLGPADLQAQPDGPLARGREVHPRDPAYLLYTSGSTGLPKGAVVRHDGAVNHVFAEAELLGLDGSIRFLQSAPASSDISVWQMLAPLVLGGRTVIADTDTVADAEQLIAVLRDEAVTLFEPVPAVLRALLDHAATLPAEEKALPAMRCVMATGETVPVDLVNDWLSAYPGTTVVNAYGPTEASDDVTQAAITQPLPTGTHAVSIGRPIPNLDCWIVDDSFGLVPDGVPGELCIGGIAVGDGYLGQPARTGGAFVPDPFSGTPGATLYRTGDRVRRGADGQLEFLGRIDQQVKVRGFRIEPGEIETALRAHDSIADCAVVVRGGTELAAFVVAAPGGSVNAAELRDHLRERVPEHMVPAVFIPLDALPLTPAGKTDRRALQADARGGVEPAAAHVEPRTPTEEVLAAIWAEVLRRERVSVEADFFELGGHSLLASMVAARVRRTLAVDLPLRRVFEHTTVARLAAHVDGLDGAAPREAGPSLRRVARAARRVGEAGEGVLKTL